MDFHGAMEAFAEAWVATNSNTQAVDMANAGPQAQNSKHEDNLTTMLTKEQTSKDQQPPGQSQLSPPVVSGVKSLPIHCIIEQTSGPLTFEHETCAGNATVEMDSYAILPSTTAFHDLVRAALLKLGYSSAESMAAKGAIQIKNWKPLSFDTITNDSKASVEDILGELIQVATLRIRISSQTKISSNDEIKGKLLQLLLTQSQDLLLNAGCPIEQGLLSSISVGENLAHLPTEIRRSFDKWYKDQLQKSQKSTEVGQPLPTASEKSSTVKTQAEAVLSNNKQSPSNVYMPLVGKTRMRTSFDPEHEIPRLQKWFQENQHPPRELMIRYLQELNSLDSRKGRRPLDLTNIIYWFKNARAAHRRASRCFDGDGFEIEDNHDLSPNGTESNHSYLNSKHPLYMLPYPFQGMYGSHDPSCDMKEPCDLSQSSKMRHRDEKCVEEDSLNSKHCNEKSKEDVVDDLRRNEEDEKNKDTNEKVDDHVDSQKTPETMPVLPNKNAVYVLPYPYHGNFGTKDDQSCSTPPETKEACDLSVYTKSKSSHHTYGQKEDEKADKENEDCNDNNQLAYNDKDSISKCKTKSNNDTVVKELSVSHSEVIKHAKMNGIYHSGSEGEEMESDYDDDQSYDGSESSHETSTISIKKENQDGHRGYHGNKMSQLQQTTASGLHQPLHIPHFPHPLAMHYFPMNSHFLQQTARYQQHQQHQSRQQLSPPIEHHKSGLNDSHLHSHHRKRRTRVFIDPMSEIPKLEKWFAEDTHPSSYMIDKYCEELNRSDYRQKFPKLEAKNVQLWFKNHRAKVKRMRVSSVDLHSVSEYTMEKC